MPWSEHVSEVTVTELRDLKPSDGVESDQFGAAKGAAVALITSGAVGGERGQRYNVGLSGHANPDHEPCEGSALDGVVVSVSQAES